MAERVARKRRKGRKGCYICGKTTEVSVQVWMREFTSDRDKANNRKQKSVKSASVSMCREHGDAFYDYCTETIPVVPEHHESTGDMAKTRARWHEKGAP